jgi:hypothetical protein
VEWYCSEPRLSFNRTVVLRYRIFPEQKRYAPSTINLRPAAVRRVAFEAADSGLLSPELAAGIRRVKGVRRIGVRPGNWLTMEQGKRLPGNLERESLRGIRNYAILVILIGCGHIRTVPIPAWERTGIEKWMYASGITNGALFRSIDKRGRIWGTGMTPNMRPALPPRRRPTGPASIPARTRLHPDDRAVSGLQALSECARSRGG